MASCPPIIHAPLRHGLFRRKTSNAWKSSRRLKTADLDDARHLTIRGKIGLIYREIVWWAVRRAVVGAGEEPRLSPQRNSSERAFGSIVAQANPAVIEEAREGIDALEHVIHGLGDIVVT